MKKLRVAILSTYFENIGDDLIRSGIIHHLQSNIAEIEFTHLSKSNELSLYFDFGKFTHSPRWQMSKIKRRMHDAILRRIPEFIKKSRFSNRVLKSDALIVAGTPLFYFTHNRYTFLNSGFWSEKIILRCLNSNIPVFVIGSGFLLDSSAEKIQQRCKPEINFLQQLISKSYFFSVRDSISADFLKAVLPGVPFISGHCPSLWNPPARNNGQINNTIIISFSLESSRIDTDAVTAIKKRNNALELIVGYLQKNNFNIKLISHNIVDYQTQLDIFKKFNLPLPVLIDAKEMVEIFGAAKAVITWRVHGAMAALINNVPTLLFKTDNRYKMAEDVGAVILDDRYDNENTIMSALVKLIETCKSTKDISEIVRPEILNFLQIFSERTKK